MCIPQIQPIIVLKYINCKQMCQKEANFSTFFRMLFETIHIFPYLSMRAIATGKHRPRAMRN